jgi:glycosyltransferase involved in cell wall biosynthesis
MLVAMLYTWDPSKEFTDYREGRVPAHRLFGAAELPQFGVDVTFCRWRFVPRRLRRLQFWKLWQTGWVLFGQRKLSCIVATTEASALPVLLMRRLGLIRRPVVVLSVAVLADHYRSGVAGAVRRFLLRRADIVTAYASGQVPMLERHLGLSPQQTRFLPFGVDIEFFQPGEHSPQWDVVAVGTNDGKDYPTLVRALPEDCRCLIVTDAPNAAQVRSTPAQASVLLDHDVPILQLRDHYAAARRHVIPLRPVPYSSGQTVLLENLSMGRPVIVSDVEMIRDYVTPEVARLVPPGDVDAMRSALAEEPPASVPAAVAHVRQHFSSTRFSADLADICRTLSNRSRTVDGIHRAGQSRLSRAEDKRWS